MRTVVLFRGEGTYSGKGAYRFQPPETGARHTFILFLCQTDGEPAWDTAMAEMDQFGFDQVAFDRAGKIQVESLNSAPGFSKHYEEALSEGSSLLWYPNATTAT